MIEALLSVLTPAQILAVGSLALLSLADLRDRALPGIRIFFFTAVTFGAFDDPWKTLMVLLALGWGIAPRLPALLILPALFYPAALPVLLTSAGVRRGLIARGDLLAITGIACLMDSPGLILVLIGAISFRGFWKKLNQGITPALPGMLLGTLLAIWWE